jgi:hypothetical protein
MIHAGDKHDEPVLKDCSMERRKSTASMSMCSMHTDYCLAVQSMANDPYSKRKSSQRIAKTC